MAANFPLHLQDRVSLEELNTRYNEATPPKRRSAVLSMVSVKDSLPFAIVRECFFIALILLSQLFTTAGIGIGIATLHPVSDHFGVTDPGKRGWYVAAFSLTAGTFILIAGRLGDMYGHKKLVVAAYAWYGVWTIVCGASYYTNDIFFSVCRGFQGLGPAFLCPNALALVGRIYPDGLKKNLIFAFFGACAPGGYVIGAAGSALLAERVNWAWSFWIMGIALLMLSAYAQLVIPAPEPSPMEKRQSWGSYQSKKSIKSFDYLGAIFGVSALILFNATWNQAPVAGWGNPYIPVLLVLSIAFFVAFVIAEQRVSHPLLPVKSLTAPVVFVLSATAVGWASFGIWLYYLWEFLQELRHHSPLLVAAQNTPAALSALVASVTTGLLITHIPVPYIMIFALFAFIITPILSATMPIDQTYWSQTFVANFLIPFGMDMSFPAATIILSNSVPKQHQGIAASLVLTVCNYSISLGLGIAGTVVQQTVKDPMDLLAQYRSGWYTAIGLAGFGLSIAVMSAAYYKRHPLPPAAH